MFAGIGGFRSGLEAVGGFRCVGYCEIDPYPRRAYEALYDTSKEVCYHDARTIDPAGLPDFDLLCGGFPCQSFSCAGRGNGFNDPRGTLFFELARLAEAKRPRYLLFENVAGLLSHDEGRTFQTILLTLDELGYDVAWQVLNSKDFGVPQSRNRVYIVGYLRGECAGEVLAFTQTSPSPLSEIGKHREGDRVYDSNGVSCTLTANCGGFGGRTGMYAVPINCKTILGYQTAFVPESIEGVAKKSDQAVIQTAPQACFVDLNENPAFTDIARCITARQDAGVGSHPRERSGVFQEIRDGEYDGKFVLIVTDAEGEVHYGVIRKLTPRECWRLQGFTDEQFNKVAALGFSDGRLYKMAGNAVSVPVISALGRRIKEIDAQGVGKEELCPIT
ncbi:MAG: DNA (cytosine-5-)-methyltransferase [Oscillospiraceae bacterium]|nr:DNA (cytosine-5-)-methyltransferase [Oscillospiraceae bacterium]